MLRLLIIAVLLTGCNGGGLLRGSGQETQPPYGYSRLCAEYPDNPACTP